MTSAPLPTPDEPRAARTVRPAGTARGWFRQLGIDTAYALVGLPLAVIAFTLVVAGISAGVGLLAAFLLGIPVLVGMLYVARGLAEVERARLAPVLRRHRESVRYRPAPAQAGWVRRLVTPMADVQYWLDALHAMARFPISVASFCVVTTWWAMSLAGVTYGLYDWALPYDVRDPVQVDGDRLVPYVLGLADTAANRILVYTAIGVVFAVTLPAVVRLCALVEAWVAQGMLNGVANLRAEVTVSQARTVAAVSAEATALRRLERDLHDGPQQRLVRLAVDLGRARQQLETDPAAAASTVDEALAQTRETLDELRTLSRGIAPPILTDRGLAAALAALAARSTVPVTLELAELPRLSPLAEQTAYFTVAEALTNLAKHSGAQEAVVSATLADGTLVVTVADDGHGGAQLAKGHGLAGLDDRLRAAGGTLVVTSPPGGPTTVQATLPS